jgi:hypothetical protein
MTIPLALHPSNYRTAPNPAVECKLIIERDCRRVGDSDC